MKKIAFLGAMMASLTVFAGSAVVDGTDFVVTADAGESFTNSTAIGDYARLVKRGAGEVVLTAATTAFTGEVVVATGTLALTDRFAVGTGTPVTVEDGATFWLRIPHPTGNQGSPVFTGHKMTIVGKGVDGGGAFRYTRTNASGNADNMFSHVELAGDATVECASRWGMSTGNLLDLKGHTLTRVGGPSVNWIFYNKLTAGTIMPTTGYMTFQSGPEFLDGTNTLIVVTNTATLALWDASNPINAAIKLYTGRTFISNSGLNPRTHNIINGPIHLAKFGTETNAYIETRYYNGKTVMTINGAITGDKGSKSDEHVRLVKKGPGTLWLNGPVDIPGYLDVNEGLLALTSTATRTCYALRGKSGSGIVASILLTDGDLRPSLIRLANGGNYRGVLRQTGGCLTDALDAPRFGESNGSQGFYTLEGGEAHFSNSVYFAERVGSFGAFRQTGGLFETRRQGSTYLGPGGSAIFVQTGGTNDTLVVVDAQSGGFQMSTNDMSEATVSGTGTLFRTSLLQLGFKNCVSTNIFNLSNGAVLKANRFRQAEYVLPGSLVCMNADGGVLMPTYPWGWSAAGASSELFFPRALQHIVVWKNGLVIDTTENAINASRPDSSVLALSFESPAGKGVESVAMPTASGFVATNYIGIARVVFEDATGWGASAYAEYDHDLHKVTHIVVTSRGCNYGDGTKAYLESPDRKSRYECALTLTGNEGLAGELVKRGAPRLDLYGTNTITGGIAVETGTLYTGTGGVIPSNTPVRVESGATLLLNNNGSIAVSTFTGAGTVSNGTVTVTNAVRATCAELFANKHATFAKNLTFAEGAVFEITDPENLETYKNEGSVTAFTAASVVGTPTLRIPDDYTGSTKWALFKSGAGSYKFGPIIGTMILLK